MDSVKAFEFGAELRVLPFGESMRGFYLATYLDYATLAAPRPDLTFSHWWSHGLLIGWQWFPLYNVAAGVSMGAEIWYFPDSERSYRELGYGGSLIGRIQIGYAW